MMPSLLLSVFAALQTSRGGNDAGVNPLTVAGYVAGILLCVPVVVAMVKAVFFFASATTKLDNVVAGLDELKTEVREFRHEKNDQIQGVEMSLTIIESDINTLQGKAGLTVRPFPDRRVGPSDRRAS